MGLRWTPGIIASYGLKDSEWFWQTSAYHGTLQDDRLFELGPRITPEIEDSRSSAQNYDIA